MKNKNKYNRGELSFEVEILLFILGIFVIWVLTGGSSKKEEVKPFLKSTPTEIPQSQN